MATPKNKNSEYWQKRFKAIENRSHNKGLKSLAYIALEYEKAEKELNDKIVLWYERFAKNNDITLAEAKKMLTAKELKEFQWTVEEYIKYAEENALNQKWMKELENASARVHIERFEALKLDMKATIEKLYAVQNSTLSKTLGDIYSDTYYRSCFEVQKAFGLGWNVSKVSENKLKNTLSTPWATDGSNFSSRLWNNREKLVSEVQNIVTRGIMTGKAPDKMTDELYKTMGSSKRNAGRVIMTETAAISAMSQNDAYEELGVEEFEIIETLDGTTCEVCGELDGKHFPKSEYKIGVTVPPFHPWCRGCTAPYFEDMKGISTRAARHKDGTEYSVPNDMTYSEWKKTQDEAAEISEKPLKNNGESGIINTEEMLRRKGSAHRRIGSKGQQIIDVPTYNKLTKEFRANGGMIIRGKEAEEHLKISHASASYLVSFNTAVISDEATISDVLEEMYHAKQDRLNMFGSVADTEVYLRREIDAQKYMLGLIDKYKISDDEVETTKKNLKYYKEELKKYLKEEV